MSQTIVFRDGEQVLLPQDIWDTAWELMEDMASAPFDGVPAETVFDLYVTMLATALWAERMGPGVPRQ